jgi:hypothetical protein
LAIGHAGMLMIWPFKKRQSSDGELFFTDSSALFSLTCKYGYTRIEPNKGVVAIVLDATKELGVPEHMGLEPDGRQTVVLRVASEDGGFLVLATTSGRGPLLNPKDAVVWVPYIFSEEVAKISPDKRIGWVGLIRAKINFPTPFKNPMENLTRYD